MSAVMTSRSMPSLGTKYSFCRPWLGGAGAPAGPLLDDMVCVEWGGVSRRGRVKCEGEGGKRLTREGQQAWRRMDYGKEEQPYGMAGDGRRKRRRLVGLPRRVSQTKGQRYSGGPSRVLVRKRLGQGWVTRQKSRSNQVASLDNPTGMVARGEAAPLKRVAS
jgi:hypothetical protein